MSKKNKKMAKKMASIRNAKDPKPTTSKKSNFYLSVYNDKLSRDVTFTKITGIGAAKENQALYDILKKELVPEVKMLSQNVINSLKSPDCKLGYLLNNTLYGRIRTVKTPAGATIVGQVGNKGGEAVNVVYPISSDMAQVALCCAKTEVGMSFEYTFDTMLTETSETSTGRKMSTEFCEAVSLRMQGNTNVRGKSWFTNGKVNCMRFECPEGFRPGITRKN